MKYFSALVLLVLVYGCENNNSKFKFTVNAIYQAPLSNYQMTIASNGYAVPESDTAKIFDGKIMIEPTIDIDSIKTIEVLINSTDKNIVFTFDTGEILMISWSMEEDYKAFQKILTYAGYSYISVNETKESLKAIYGALNGPQGVLLKGQSKYLNVIKVG